MVHVLCYAERILLDVFRMESNKHELLRSKQRGFNRHENDYFLCAKKNVHFDDGL